jgi:PKD repeat protein
LIAAVPVQGCAPLEVDFTNNTDPALLDESAWMFGDGGNSPLQNPTYTYDEPGVYDVTLEVTSPDGCVSDTTYEDLIQVFQVPVAAFTADTLEGCMGLQVQFTNTTDTLTGTCSWDFGDGGTSNVCDPLYTYNTAGLFTVELSVTSPNN